MVETKSKMYYTAYEYPYPCIYKLVFGDDFYIGQTINLKQRVQNHVYNLNKGYANAKMLEAYHANNCDFKVEIVEVIPPDSTPGFLTSRERYYIKALKPTINSEKYGSVCVSSRCKGRKMIREDLIVMSNAEAVKKHHAKLDEFKIRPYKEEGQQIREYASELNMSVQGLFLEAVKEYMDRHPLKPFWEE